MRILRIRCTNLWLDFTAIPVIVVLFNYVYFPNSWGHPVVWVTPKVTKQRIIYLSLVPTCPKNRKSRGFLRSFDVWDSYDQCEHPIADIPDGRRFLRRDRKNRKHFYFEVLSQTVPDVGDFYDECEQKICLSGTVVDDAREEFVNDQQHVGLSAADRIIYQDDIRI